MFGPLQLLQPTSVVEASAALEQFGDKAKIYAGGAELLLLLRQGLLRTDSLVDIKKSSDSIVSLGTSKSCALGHA
jgi:CO/xanthine dehydrogenase FAD-binding subunit